jgi:hypothetical protein
MGFPLIPSHISFLNGLVCLSSSRTRIVVELLCTLLVGLHGRSNSSPSHWRYVYNTNTEGTQDTHASSGIRTRDSSV